VEKYRLYLTAATMAAVVCLSGCRVPTHKYEGVFDRYYMTTLKMSTSSDVLAVLQTDEELLSTSQNVVATWGKTGDKDRTHWFNMVAFDEDTMLAARKYGFILEETRWGWNRAPLPALRFDAEIVMPAEALEAAYPSANARLIELLKESRDAFKSDAAELTYDADVLRGSVMMVQQALNTVIVKLTQSPAYAVYLPQLEGMEFDHPTLNESRIRMVIEEDVVKIKIKAGKPWFQDPAELLFNEKPFENHPDVKHM
jgi:hypothetical protein